MEMEEMRMQGNGMGREGNRKGGEYKNRREWKGKGWDGRERGGKEECKGEWKVETKGEEWKRKNETYQ
jgi:hypothetical protein